MNCRLLYLVGQLRPGGQERQLCYLLQGLDRERYRPAVVVWSFHENDLFVPHIRTLDVPLYYFPPASAGLVKLAAFRSMVRRLNPELVHSYSFWTNFAAWWATLRTESIAIGSIRNDLIMQRQDAGCVLGRVSARWPATQIANSLAVQKAVEASSSLFKPTRVYLVHNGMDIGRIRPYPVPKNGPALLAIGRLFPEKRWDRLLRIVASVSMRGLKFSLRLAGDGPLREELQSLAKHLHVEELVEFVGVRRDILSLLKDSTFLVHTADAEGYPNVIMEAMASGRAVVATDAGDVPYLVEDGKTGFVIRRGDDFTLAERVATLINNHDLCCRMGEAGRVKAEREFGLHRLVSKTLAAYQAAGWGG